MIFTKKPPAPKPEPAPTGSEQLRRLLQSRTRRRSLLAISGDINDIATTEANRATARNIANNMAGGASSEVAASLARTLVGALPGVNAETRVTTEAALESFIGGGDLPVDGKIWLVRYLHGDHKTFDGERDEIVLANAREPSTYVLPARWINPDPVIAEAQRVYQAALDAARRR